MNAFLDFISHQYTKRTKAIRCKTIEKKKKKRSQKVRNGVDS